MSKYYLNLKRALECVENGVEMDCYEDACKMFLVDFIRANFNERVISRTSGIVNLDFDFGERV